MMTQSSSSQTTSDDLEKECFRKANKLIKLCHLPFPKVTSLRDLNSRFFLHLFKIICKVPLLDVVEPRRLEDHAHNVQVLIDTLSLDILGISMTHITGEDVVAGNVSSIYNLLEVLEGYYLFVVLSPTVDPQKVDEDVYSDSITDTAAQICSVCGYHELGKKNANLQVGDSKDWCPVCRKQNQIRSTRSEPTKLVKDHQFQDPSLKSTSSWYSEPSTSGIRQLFEKPLPDAFEKLKTNIGLFANSVARSISAEDEKLKRKYTGVPIQEQETSRTDSERDSDSEVSSLTSFFGIKKEKNRISTSTGSFNITSRSSSTFSPPPLDDFLSNGFLSKKYSLSSDSFSDELPVRDHDYDDEVTLPKQRMPMSTSDVSCTQTERQDSTTQTLDSCSTISSQERTTPRMAREHIAMKCPEVVHKEIVDSYGKNLELRIRSILEKDIQHERRASEIYKMYQRSLKSPKRKSGTPVCRKSFLLPYDLRRRPSATRKKTRTKSVSKQPQPQPSSSRMSTEPLEDEAPLIRELRVEFPGVHLSPNSVRTMTDKYRQHLNTLHKNVKDTLLKTPLTQIQTEEAIKRQQILSDILKKDVEHVHKLNDVKENQALAQQLKAKKRNARLSSARAKQYFDEFHTEMQKKMQKRNYQEEQLVKNVFQEGLNMQKEQIRLLRQQMKEKEVKDAQHNRIYLEALENFYQTQFDMLAESLATEKHDIRERAKAQEGVLRKMKRQQRQEKVEEIRQMQEQLVRNNEDVMHFRELDAERFRERLRDRFSAHPLAKNAF